MHHSSSQHQTRLWTTVDKQWITPPTRGFMPSNTRSRRLSRAFVIYQHQVNYPHFGKVIHRAGITINRPVLDGNVRPGYFGFYWIIGGDRGGRRKAQQPSTVTKHNNAGDQRPPAAMPGRLQPVAVGCRKISTPHLLFGVGLKAAVVVGCSPIFGEHRRRVRVVVTLRRPQTSRGTRCPHEFLLLPGTYRWS